MTITTQLTLNQQTVLDKIRALKMYTVKTGFRTTRSINDILSSLDAADLAAVVQVLNADDQK